MIYFESEYVLLKFQEPSIAFQKDKFPWNSFEDGYPFRVAGRIKRKNSV